MDSNSTYVLFIYFSSNNILFNLTTLKGKTIFSLSAGEKKTKGIRKITLTSLKYLASKAALFVYRKKIHVKIKGLSKLKKLTLKLTLKLAEAQILSFCDLTSLPHNGSRLRKNRRV